MAITARRENPAGYECHYGPCQYTSARLLTAGKFSRTQGRFEARLKLPKGARHVARLLDARRQRLHRRLAHQRRARHHGKRWQGTRNGLGEHSRPPGYSGANASNASYTLPDGKSLGDAFHTFTVDWGPESITWYIDGTAFSRKTKAATAGPWVFDHDFFLLLNLAVGGYWPGAPASDTAFPQSLLIDYVRVYELASVPAAPSSAAGTRIQGYAGKCIDVAGRQASDGGHLAIVGLRYGSVGAVDVC